MPESTHQVSQRFTVKSLVDFWISFLHALVLLGPADPLLSIVKVINDASRAGFEYMKYKVEREGRQGRATWSLFLLLSRIPISRVIAVGYVSSHYFLLSFHRGFGVDLGAI